MWIIKETEDELTIKGYPLLKWSLVLGCFILGFLILRVYLEDFGGILMIAKIFEGKLLDILTNIGVLSLLPFCGLILFYFSPLIITKFNRRKRVVTQHTFTLLGKKTREFGFDYLKGGVRVKSEEIDNSNYYSLYFEINSDERIDLSKEFPLWKGRAFDIAVKANEFLQKRIEN